MFIPFHFSQQIEQGGFQFLGVIDGKVAVLVMDDAIRRALAVGLFNQQAVGSQLIDMGIIGRVRRP